MSRVALARVKIGQRVGCERTRTCHAQRDVLAKPAARRFPFVRKCLFDKAVAITYRTTERLLKITNIGPRSLAKVNDDHPSHRRHLRTVSSLLRDPAVQEN